MAQPEVEEARSLSRAPSAVIILAHGGVSRSMLTASRMRLTYLWQRWVSRWIVAALAGTDAQVWRLRYRVRGWNGSRADPAADLRWAVDKAERLHPGVPVILIGHSMGARAAIFAADQPSVAAVLLLAPWIEPGDPVDRLAGKDVEIIHGTADRMTNPATSFAVAQRFGLRYVPIPDEGHTMLGRPTRWRELVTTFLDRRQHLLV
jgi:alpha-beta hydrolase superfamily lysophospholipase